MDEDLMLMTIQDSYLDIDDINNVPILSTTPTSEEGVTDGSTSTDLDNYTSDPDVEVTELGDGESSTEEVSVSVLGIDVTGFVPVNYSYDDEDNFINKDDPGNPYVEELLDNTDDEIPDI